VSVRRFLSEPQGALGKQKGNVVHVPYIITGFLAPSRFLCGTVTYDEHNVNTPVDRGMDMDMLHQRDDNNSQGNSEVLGEEPAPDRFMHYRSHMDWLGIESEPTQ
jgi:hypothetical protein